VPKIIISNCWSYYNKGDAAIAISTADYIHKKFKNYDITLLAVDSESFNDNINSFNYPIQILPMIHRIEPFQTIGKLYSLSFHYLNGLFSFVGIFYLMFQILLMSILRHISSKTHEITSEIENADLVIAVGGNYLWSNEGLYNHLIPLIYAKYFKKKKVILLGHSIGPFRNRIDRYIAKLLLKKMDLTIFREEVSYNYVKNNDLSDNNEVILSDLAFLLDLSITNQNTRKPIIGFTIRKWLKRKPILFNKYISSIVKLIEKLSREGYKIYLIPFSYLPGDENDVEICNKVLNIINEDLKNNIIKVDIKNKSPTEIVECLSEYEISILVGTRLHSIILASLANIPSIVISYQHFKALGISEQLGINNYLMKIDEIEEDELKNKFVDLSTNYISIKNYMQSSVNKIRSDLDFNVERLINQVLEN